MFDAFGPWTWVAIAWLELVVAYGGYFAYLTWRARRLARERDER